MKGRFYVLFCQKNLQKPLIYKKLDPILKKMSEHKTYTYQ